MRLLRSGKTLAATVTVAAVMIAPSACGTEDDADVSTSETSQETPEAEPEPAEDDSSTPDRRESDRNDKASSANAEDEGGTTGENDENDESGNEGESKRDRRRGNLFTVTEVVDGDTVHLDKPGETSVRIIGIETPETVHPSEPVECGGPAASNAAEQLLAGQRVRLVHDPTQGRTDAYGRILGYIDIPGVGDYGLAMIERGYAAEYTYDNAYRRQQRYRATEQRAQDVSQGVWGTCGGVDTPLEEPTTEPEPQTQAPAEEGSGSGCASGYSPCIPAYPPDLNCDDVDGPIAITGDDPHGFDADGDGIGCDT